MARLLALVADLLAVARILRAVAREVAGLATVVALAAVDAVACEKRKRKTKVLEAGHNKSPSVAGVAEHLRDMWPIPPQE